MAELSPDYQICNNSHAIIHTGPIGPEGVDPGNDLHISTSSKCQTHWNKNGTKTEHVISRWDEVSGVRLDPPSKNGKTTKESNIARTINAMHGDIHMVAEDGDIYLKARNIYIETTGPMSPDGKSHGNFLVSSNGHVIITGQDKVQITSGTHLCLTSPAKVNIISPEIFTSGQIKDSGPFSATGIITKIKSGNYGALLEGILQSCK